MKSLPHLLSLLGVAAASAYGLAGCGGDEITCGTGTVLEGDMCVPSNTTTCGTGTTLMGDECVPDGSVICEQGTRFDMATGTCVVDPSACAAGTVLVGGECVPEDDTLTADLEEATEPNDATGAGAFNLPAVNEDVTLHGCISPRGGVRDEDVWIMTATGPTLVEITADGVGGLAAGFIVQDLAIPSLPNYFRAGINLTGDTSKRQVFLPAAGDYLLIMDDSRAILVDEVAGGPGTCYYTTVKTVAMPSATALTTPQQTGTDDGNVRVLSFTADGEGDILRSVLNTGSESLSPAFVVMRGNNLVASAAPATNPSTGAVTPPQWTEGGMALNEVLTIIVDNQYNFAPSAPYTIDSLDLSAQALPVDGSTISVSGRRAGTDGTLDLSKHSYLYFDVAANGALVQWNFTSSVAVDMFIVRKNIVTNTAYQVFALPNSPTVAGGLTTFTNQFTRFLQAGRYYVIIQNPATTATVGETIMVTSTLTTVTPSAVTYGTASTGNALPASGSGFHTIDFTNPTWVEFHATAADWGSANVRIGAFDPAGEGWMGTAAPANYLPVFSGTQAASGTAPFGRIMVGDTRDYILRVDATAAVGTAPTYDLTVRDRPHIALGAIMPGTPIMRTADPLTGPSNGATAQNVTRYLITGPAFGAISALVTPAGTADPIIRRRGVDENSIQSFDVGADGDPETLTGTFAGAPNNFIAFTVGDFNTGNTTFDLTVTATPPPYTPTSGTLSFVDACVGGTTVMTGADDTLSAAISLPATMAAFPFFGAATTGQIRVSSNGWFTFDTATTTSTGNNGPLPNTSAPNALVAPYWEDLVNITVCTRASATGDAFWVQWSGTLYNVASEIAQFQVVLHDNGVIDFVYGPNHTLNGSEIDTFFATSGATVGVENATGTAAIQLHFNQNAISPSTSRTLTPAP